MLTLNNLVNDGILELSNTAINITEQGKDFVSFACRVFDKYRRADKL